MFLDNYFLLESENEDPKIDKAKKDMKDVERAKTNQEMASQDFNDAKRRLTTANRELSFANQKSKQSINNVPNKEKNPSLKTFREEEEEAEFFNSNDGSETYETKDIDKDDLLDELSVVNEDFVNEDLKPLFISLVNDKPVFNESKNIDEVYLSRSTLLENNCQGRDMIVNVVFLNESEYEIVDEYLNEEYNKFESILIDKVNNRENSNLVCSQFIDAILCENFSQPINKKVYTIYSGKTINYNDKKLDKILSNVQRKAKPLNESFDFYSNGFNKKDWNIYI